MSDFSRLRVNFGHRQVLAVPPNYQFPQLTTFLMSSRKNHVWGYPGYNSGRFIEAAALSKDFRTSREYVPRHMAVSPVNVICGLLAIEAMLALPGFQAITAQSGKTPVGKTLLDRLMIAGAEFDSYRKPLSGRIIFEIDTTKMRSVNTRRRVHIIKACGNTFGEALRRALDMAYKNPIFASFVDDLK